MHVQLHIFSLRHSETYVYAYLEILCKLDVYDLWVNISGKPISGQLVCVFCMYACMLYCLIEVSIQVVESWGAVPLLSTKIPQPSWFTPQLQISFHFQLQHFLNKWTLKSYSLIEFLCPAPPVQCIVASTNTYYVVNSNILRILLNCVKGSNRSTIINAIIWWQDISGALIVKVPSHSS